MPTSFPELTCAICDGPVRSLEECFRATGKFLPRGDALAKYETAPLHWTCYTQWPQRARFARAYVDAWVAANRKNPFWWGVLRTDQVYVSVNPSKPVEEASVRLYAYGSDLRVPLARWSAWLSAPETVTPNLPEPVRTALAGVLPTLKTRLPDDHALVDAIDPVEKPGGRR